MSLSRIVATVLVVPLLAGCAYIGSGGSPEASPDPSPTPTDAMPSPTQLPGPTESPLALPTATASPGLTPEPTPAERPTVQPSSVVTPSASPSYAPGLQASNEFWQWWWDECWFGAPPGTPASLQEMVTSSPVVLRGSVVDVQEGRDGGWSVVNVIVGPTEVLKGEPALRDDGLLLVQVGLETRDLDELRSHLPAHDNLWFLRPADQGDRYYMADYPQISVLRDIEGVVRVIRPGDLAVALSKDHYPVPLEGTSFYTLLERVRQLVLSSSHATALAVRSGGARGEPQTLFAC